MITKINDLLKDKNAHELARRMSAAGYPITYPTILYWKNGQTAPRIDRLLLAEMVIRPRDPEIADLINEIISALG